MKQLKSFFTKNRTPKLICLLLSIIIWLGVHYGLVETQGIRQAQGGDIILSAP